MHNLRPSNVKVIFQRPSCDYPYSGGSGFYCRSARVVESPFRRVITVALRLPRVTPRDVRRSPPRHISDASRLSRRRRLTDAHARGVTVAVISYRRQNDTASAQACRELTAAERITFAHLPLDVADCARKHGDSRDADPSSSGCTELS